MAKTYGLPNLGNLRTPLEGIDMAADMLNRAATLPGQVVGGVLDAAGSTFNSVQRAIAAPRDQPERPIPPDKLVMPIPQAVGDIVTGVIDVVKSGVDAVVDNVDGARREVEQFIRG